MQNEKLQVKEYVLMEQIISKVGYEFYLAISTEETKKNKIYFVKRINLDFKEEYKKFRKEAKMFDKPSLFHKNLLKCVSIIKTKYNAHFVYEYCEIGNLKEFMKAFKEKFLNLSLPPGIVQKIMKDLICSVCKLHSANIIHRDIKLKHFMLKFKSLPNLIENVLKISDFSMRKEFAAKEKNFLNFLNKFYLILKKT